MIDDDDDDHRREAVARYMGLFPTDETFRNNTWPRQFDTRPHRCRTRIVYSYSPGVANVHRHLVHNSLSQCKFFSGWLGRRVVSVLDSGAEGPWFKSQSRRCRVTVLGKLFTPILPLFTKLQTGSSPVKGCGGNCRPGGK